MLIKLCVTCLTLQKQTTIPGVLAGKEGGVPKVAVQQKKVTVKPNPEAIIVISPDTEEEVKKEKHLNKKHAGDGSSKKKCQTFTSTLTARSKVHKYDFLSIFLGIIIWGFVGFCIANEVS